MLVSQGGRARGSWSQRSCSARRGADAAATAWAAGVGGLGLLGLIAFYRALAIGTMSIVAPISATGVTIPVLVGLTSGERPGALQLVGMLLAFAGVVMAAREPPSADADERRTARTAVWLALLAAIGFGSFFAGIDRAEETGDVAWVLLAARTADVAAAAGGLPSSARGSRPRRRRSARSPRSGCSTCSPTCCSCSPRGAAC